MVTAYNYLIVSAPEKTGAFFLWTWYNYVREECESCEKTPEKSVSERV